MSTAGFKTSKLIYGKCVSCFPHVFWKIRLRVCLCVHRIVVVRVNASRHAERENPPMGSVIIWDWACSE